MTQPTLPPTPQKQQSQEQQQLNKRRVRISEEPAQTLIFVEHLTPQEHTAMWYTQEEYQEMKDNRYKVLRAAKKKAGKNNSFVCSCSHICNDNPSTSTSSSRSDNHTEPADILCLRGLEQLLPNGKSRVQQKRETVAAIVKMYQQLKACCPEVEGEAEANDGAAKSQTQSREEVLKTFCLSKTRYAQHAANLMAVQDAACLLPLEETTTTATTTAHAGCNSCCCGARSATSSSYYHYYFNKKRYSTHSRYTTNKQQTLVNRPLLIDRTTTTTTTTTTAAAGGGRGTSRGVTMRAPTA